MHRQTILPLMVAMNFFCFCHSYSALEDARIINEYKRQLRELDHPKIARTLVHKASWAAFGTISTDDKILNYPMVNIISVDDSNLKGESTGNIRFLLTNLDFTGKDLEEKNQASLLFSAEQNQDCSKKGMDPMEPTCPRAIFSGEVVEFKEEDPEYKNAIAAFTKRHPAATNWLHAHNFYLCQLKIKNIYVLDFYGGPHNVRIEDYYNAQPDN